MIYTPSKNLRISLQTFVLVAVVFALLFSPLDHPVIGAAAESGGIKVYCNGNFRGSTAFIDARSGVGMVPLALIEGLPGLRLNVRDNRAWFALNGRELTTTLDSSNYIMDGQQYHWRCGLQPWKYGIAVPARDLFEALDASVRWDGENRAIYINAPVQSAAVPQRVTGNALPLRLAFTHEERLWLLDADKAGAQPQPVSTPKVDHIIGWSHDGQWLAYLQRQRNDKFSGDLNLWVVGADGQQPQRLDDRPVVPGTPVWSPVENAIAYQTCQQADQESLNKSLELARRENEKWVNCAVLPGGQQLGTGLAWFPDGQSLAISWVRSDKELPAIDRINLQGQISRMFTLPLAEAGKIEDGIFVYEMAGLKLSPDGRYLTCFLGLNSASLNADGMALQVIDLQNPQTPFTVGGALGYPEWLAWSPDSRQLACIMGCDRFASTGQQLVMVELENGQFQVKNLGQPGMVDARPFWEPYGQRLFYARGQENLDWLEEGRYQEVRVPGQQVWSNTDTDTQPLTTPESTQADYPLSLSPDGRFLAVQRLNYFDLGSLYLLNTEDGNLVELLDNLQTNSGYYGNYYPDTVSIYWIEAVQPSPIFK